MLTRKQKEEIVKDLSENLENSKTVIACDYKGMTVAEMSELRNSLREKEAKMKVAKKTITQVAIDNAKLDLNVTELEGQIAIFYGGNDEVSLPKTLHDFSKDNENLKVLAGSLEKKALAKEEVVALAKLPSKEELLAKAVGSIKAPISGFVNVLSGNLRGLVGVLSSIKESKESA